jgi:hypothetical protein
MAPYQTVPLLEPTTAYRYQADRYVPGRSGLELGEMRMKQKRNQPAWWVLDLLALMLVGTLLLVHCLSLSTAGEVLLQILILLVFYGLMILWLRANSAAIQHDQKHPKSEGTAGCAGEGIPLTETQARYRRAMAWYRDRKL